MTTIVMSAMSPSDSLATTRYELDGGTLVLTTRTDVDGAAVVVRDVRLPQDTEVIVPHALGELPGRLDVSSPRGALTRGRIEEVRPASAHCLVLRATGFGATIVVDLLVRP